MRNYTECGHPEALSKRVFLPDARLIQRVGEDKEKYVYLEDGTTNKWWCYMRVAVGECRKLFCWVPCQYSHVCASQI